MGSKLHVGNLSYATTSLDLQQLFAPHGAVQSADVISDRDTGDSKGFGFVRMGSDEEARAATAALHGRQHGGRALTVAEAKPRETDGRSSGFAHTASGCGFPVAAVPTRRSQRRAGRRAVTVQAAGPGLAATTTAAGRTRRHTLEASHAG